MTFHSVQEKLKKAEPEILEERVVNHIKEQVCIAESDILKTIEYKLNFELPYGIIEDICKNYFKEDKDIVYLARIIM